jgi:hypothetical protein
MFLTRRSAQVRNLAVSGVNGTVTLVILLIAPLGLAAVIVNTVLVILASLTTATIADRVVGFLQAEAAGNNQPRSGRRLRQPRDE